MVPDPNDEQTVYLVPSYQDDEEAWEVLKEVYSEIFEGELFAWHMDEKAWPMLRNCEVFKQWFSIEFHSMVEDLCRYEIVDDDDEEVPPPLQ